MSPRSRSRLRVAAVAATFAAAIAWWLLREEGQDAAPEVADAGVVVPGEAEETPVERAPVRLEANPALPRPKPAPAPKPPPPKPAVKEAAVLPSLDAVTLERKWRSSLDAIAGARTAEDRRALMEHLRRFVGGQDGARGGRDLLLGSLWRDRNQRPAKDKKEEPLPVADPEEAERRRIEQLENLIKRNAVGLLGAIDGALVWLALHQGEDGRISEASAAKRCAELAHQPKCVETAPKDDPFAVASTALAALAFLDFRDQDARGLFEPYLAGALDYLLKVQRPDGSFPGGGQLYTTGMALMALGQATASTGSERLRAATLKGLETVAANPGFRGGYRYRLGSPDADLSVTAWIAQAVEAARVAEIEVPRDLPWNLASFLDAVRVDPFGYSYTAGRGASPTLAPAGMLCDRILTRPEEPAYVSWRAWLVRPPWSPKSAGPPLYTLYYGVRLAILLDGGIPEPWRTWTVRLAAAQVKEQGPLGSWDPKNDNWFRRGGRATMTAFGALTLEHALYLR